MNKTAFIGNLTRDPQIRATKNGTAVAQFTVAVSENFTSNGEQKERTAFINVVAWGKLAEAVGNQLTKGTRVMIDGRIETRSYDDKDGRKVFVTEVNAQTVAIPLSTRQETTGGENFDRFGSRSDDIPF